MRSEFFEPLVVKCLFTVVSLLRVYIYQMFYQVFAFFGNLLELPVLERVITLFDFFKNFSGILSLEW
jgi:hypothetical protein